MTLFAKAQANADLHVLVQAGTAHVRYDFCQCAVSALATQPTRAVAGIPGDRSPVIVRGPSSHVWQ